MLFLFALLFLFFVAHIALMSLCLFGASDLVAVASLCRSIRFRLFALSIVLGTGAVAAGRWPKDPEHLITQGNNPIEATPRPQQPLTVGLRVAVIETETRKATFVF